MDERWVRGQGRGVVAGNARSLAREADRVNFLGEKAVIACTHFFTVESGMH